jgi:UDP-N-acetylmuramoyl-tripeptide--D-alanyl-D-alanine ligase
MGRDGVIPLRLDTIATVTGGRLLNADPAVLARGPVALDSRQVVPGGLFAAFDGSQVDGHAFASAAVSGGASAVLASRPVDTPAILVGDVREALTRLARYVLTRLDPIIVGVTGSFGKTTTKDLLAQILESRGPTVATTGSLNNELGLPLTVLRADDSTCHLVLEMGAAKPGDLIHQTSVAPPRVGVVLAVGSAHVGTFGGGLDEVAATKAELVDALPPAWAGGVAVLNADDPRVAAMAARTRARVVTFGRGPSAIIRAASVRLVDGMAAFTLVTPSGSHEVQLRLLGEHQVWNALAAAAAAWSLDISAARIGVALSQATARSASRLAVATREDGLTVVDDAFNAFPESVEAALRATVTLAASSASASPRRRAVAVLGEMVAQGSQTVARHEDVGRFAAELGFDVLIAVNGPDLPFYAGTGPAAMASAAAAARPAMVVRLVADRAEALAQVRELVRPGDVVLVKASHELGLSKLAADLLAE